MVGPPDVGFVVQLGCFLVLYLVLKWGVFDPALEVITTRRRAIEGSLAEAERLRREAAEMHARYEATLEAARVSTRKEIDTMRRHAEAEDERLLEQVRTETADMVAKVRETLAREVEAARATMARHAAEISLEAAEKVLGRSLR